MRNSYLVVDKHKDPAIADWLSSFSDLSPLIAVSCTSARVSAPGHRARRPRGGAAAAGACAGEDVESPPSLPVHARSLACTTESALPPTAVWSAVRTGRYAWYEVQLQRAYAS